MACRRHPTPTVLRCRIGCCKDFVFLILLMFCFEIKSDLSSTIGSSTTLSASGSRGQLVKNNIITFEIEPNERKLICFPQY